MARKERSGGAVPRAVASLWIDSRCALAECPLWCERERVLWWTDIESRRLWRFRPADAALHHWRLPDRLGSFALCESGRLLLGLAKGLTLATILGPHENDIALAPLVFVESGDPALRINDGRADRSGNFVFGTLNEAPRREPTGRFYQYSQRHGLRRLALDGIAIANSLCFSPDGSRLYFCDSLQGRILRCRYDAEAAAVGDVEVFAQVDAPASPDGAAIDRDGRLWSAQWGGGRVVCYGSDGTVEHVVALPVDHASCPVFCGDDLAELAIATARVELSPDRLAATPSAGGIFRARVAPARGLAENRFDDR